MFTDAHRHRSLLESTPIVMYIIGIFGTSASWRRRWGLNCAGRQRQRWRLQPRRWWLQLRWQWRWLWRRRWWATVVEEGQAGALGHLIISVLRDTSASIVVAHCELKQHLSAPQLRVIGLDVVIDTTLCNPLF